MHRRQLAALLTLTAPVLAGLGLTVSGGDRPKAGDTAYTAIIDVRTPARCGNPSGQATAGHTFTT